MIEDIQHLIINLSNRRPTLFQKSDKVVCFVLLDGALAVLDTLSSLHANSDRSNILLKV